MEFDDKKSSLLGVGAIVLAGLGSIGLAGNVFFNMKKQVQAEHFHNTGVEFKEKGLIPQNIQADPGKNFLTIRDESHHIFELSDTHEVEQAIGFLESVGYVDIEKIDVNDQTLIVAEVTDSVKAVLSDGIYKDCEHYK